MRRVALLVETSNSYARGLLRGVVDYAREHGRWSVYLGEHSRGDQPPPWLGRLNEHGGTLTAGNLHAAIELTLLPFNLQGRSPERAGNTVAEAAPKLLDRCYVIVEENRADLVEMVRATYANDVPVMERLRSRAAKNAAELLADAYYTALTLAGENR